MIRRTFLKLLGTSGLIVPKYYSDVPCNQRKTIWVSLKEQPDPIVTSSHNYTVHAGIGGWEDKFVQPHDPALSRYIQSPCMKNDGTITLFHARHISNHGDSKFFPEVTVKPPFLPGMVVVDGAGNRSLVVTVKLRNTAKIALGQLVGEGYHDVNLLCKELKAPFKSLKNWLVWELHVNDFDHYQFLWKAYPHIFSKTPNPWNPESRSQN